MTEKYATMDNRCPDCNGKLNVLVGVFGREVCRKCEQILITEKVDTNFDHHEWGNLGKDSYGNVRYGRLDKTVVTADPRSLGSATEHAVIMHPVSEKGVGPYEPIVVNKKEVLE